MVIPLEAKIYVAGHRGLVGSAIVRRLRSLGYQNLLLRTSSEVDLTDHAQVRDLFERERPEYVYLCAAKVGGIIANATLPADFIYQNLMIQNHVMHCSKEWGVKRLLFMGSSCIYPRQSPQPMREEYLLTGLLEKTNEPYAIAKIAGIEMCWAYNRQYGAAFLPVMPTNLYGPNDCYDLENSHVLPALLRKFREAKAQENSTVTLWGSGTVRREFLHSDDLARAVTMLMHLPDGEFKKVILADDQRPLINIGCGEDMTIRDLATLIATTVGYSGNIEWNRDKPDGTPQKLLDIAKIKSFGWKPSIPLQQGITDLHLNIRN